jgi:hypothetical protein
MSKWQGGHFGSLTPFYRAWCGAAGAIERPLPEPQALPVPPAGARHVDA